MKLARFYGWTHDDIEGLDLDTLEEYWQGITMLEAQEQLVLATTLSVQHMKSGPHETWKRRMNKDAYPRRFDTAVTLTPEQLVRSTFNRG